MLSRKDSWASFKDLLANISPRDKGRIPGWVTMDRQQGRRRSLIDQNRYKVLSPKLCWPSKNPSHSAVPLQHLVHQFQLDHSGVRSGSEAWGGIRPPCQAKFRHLTSTCHHCTREWGFGPSSGEEVCAKDKVKSGQSPHSSQCNNLHENTTIDIIRFPIPNILLVLLLL